MLVLQSFIRIMIPKMQEVGEISSIIYLQFYDEMERRVFVGVQNY